MVFGDSSEASDLLNSSPVSKSATLYIHSAIKMWVRAGEATGHKKPPKVTLQQTTIQSF